MANRLLNETSPYLLQHAHNPVDWYPWGEEAFERAKAEDKVVLVSIGYAACHWCHVMERESFENEATASVMNDLLVSIKVDREERPDVDGIYMSAVQQLHGHGGWPLNVFLLPDGRPFYGGTYFPPADRSNMPSWTRVVAAVVDAYHTKRDAVLENARVLTDALRNASGIEMADDEVTEELLAQASEGMVSLHDTEHGGFGGAPKFPQSMPMEFLLARNARVSDASAFDEDALEAVESSLTAMHNGGIYDHLGGGFARYSTDRFWLVPHFEKMLYDNALLVSLYTQAFQATGNPRYREVVEETIEYLLRDLCHPEGWVLLVAGRRQRRGGGQVLRLGAAGDRGRARRRGHAAVPSLLRRGRASELRGASHPARAGQRRGSRARVGHRRGRTARTTACDASRAP